MDERVEKAMEQWPDVPDVYDWLSLDRRGQWRLRGEPISNPNLTAFINRNYVRLDTGSYAFQNGPQCVHVELAATPWIARIASSAESALSFVDHIGATLSGIDLAYLDASGDLILNTAKGPALLTDQDLGAVLRFFCDAGGAAISDAVLDEALSDPATHALHLALAERVIPVQAQGDHAAETTFGFIAQLKR